MSGASSGYETGPAQRRAPSWLCISSDLASQEELGAQRTLNFIKGLDALGWDATALSLSSIDRHQAKLLKEQLPPTARLINAQKNTASAPTNRGRRSRSFTRGIDALTAKAEQALTKLANACIGDALRTPDSQLGQVLPAVREGLRVSRHRRPKVIYSCSPSASCHVAALLLSKITRIPWVADFRSPWREDSLEEENSAGIDFWNSAIERAVLRNASHVVCASPGLRETLCMRMPSVAVKCSTILDRDESGSLALSTDQRQEIAVALDSLTANRLNYAKASQDKVDYFTPWRQIEELASVFGKLSKTKLTLESTKRQRENFQQALSIAIGDKSRSITSPVQEKKRPHRLITPRTEAERSNSGVDLRGSKEAAITDQPGQPQPVSVIITTLNDFANLRMVLESLKRQTRPVDEAVIVDGGSDARTLVATKFLIQEYPWARLLVGKPCNIAEGRNRAIRSASFDILACIDTGCRAESTWLEHITKPFDDRAVSVVGGMYRVTPKSWLEKLTGLITMPGALKPVDPLSFNPSARSIAFRRSAWEQAHGFPNWLYTAEDTLFDLKLRSLKPQLGYAFAGDAIVQWRPRTGLRKVFKQFAGYARGEAHIGRGHDTAQYTAKRYLAMFVWLSATLVSWQNAYPIMTLLFAAIACTLFAYPNVSLALQASRKAKRALYFPAGILLGELISVARWYGYLRGRLQSRKNPEVYVHRLREYIGTDSADVCWPKWDVRSAPLTQNLIVSWHWAPTNRASANVMASLFKDAPSKAFRVLTRFLPTPPKESQTTSPPIPAHYVDWPLRTDRPVKLWTWLADVVTAWKMVRRAEEINDNWHVDRIVAVFPHRFSLLAGYIASRRLGVPFVAYMHDLCSESLITRSRIRKAFWNWVDRKALGDAWMVVVPTQEWAKHYKKRGISRTWILPHCLPIGLSASESNSSGTPLRALYSGNVYEPHEDAIASIIKAASTMDNVQLSFQSNPHPLLSGQDVQWLPRQQALDCLHNADIFIVALGFNTPYPQEVHGCFPSKITDYLAVGRPILAVVPQGCFVDRFVRESGCGISVNTLDQSAIIDALEQLCDTKRREQLTQAAIMASQKLESDVWQAQLVRKLVTGPLATEADLSQKTYAPQSPSAKAPSDKPTAPKEQKATFRRVTPAG